MHVCSAFLLLLLPYLAISINIGGKTDFGESSTGISPDIVKTIFEKNVEPTISPGVIKAVLEVNVGGLTTKTKQQTKTEEKEKKTKKNQVLICNLEGECKLHEVIISDSGDDDEKKTIKPIIVTDFNVDPSKDKKDGNVNKNTDKDVPDIPVFVGRKGAVQNGGVSPQRGNGQQPGRVPIYYGMKLSPRFHQSYPPQGSVVYEEEPRYPQTPGNSGGRTPSPYGKYYPRRNPSHQTPITSLHRRAGGDWSNVYWSSHKSNEVPHHSSSDWVGSNSPGWDGPNSPGWGGSSTPSWGGSSNPSWGGSSTPSWGGSSNPSWGGSSNPSWGGSSNPSWGGSSTPSWGGSSNPSWGGSSTPNWGSSNTPGLVSPNRPGYNWPSEKPNENRPSPPIVSVHDKMDFDEVPLNGGDDSTETSDPGKVVIKVVSKLGDPLVKEEP